MRVSRSLTVAITGKRTVSSLTPAQLARKRANDREAQRAIRSRVKEHVRSLERELEQLRRCSTRDNIVQDLLRDNIALKDEIYGLRERLTTVAGDLDSYYQPCIPSFVQPLLLQYC